MGFLTSSYMKGYAIRMKLQAQRKLMSINLEAGRVKRKMDTLQRQLKNQQRYQNSVSQINYSSIMQQNQLAMSQAMSMKDANGNMTAEGQKLYQQYQQSIFTAQNNYQMQKELNAQNFDYLYEQYLEPLKDEEERLQMEKQSAETDLAFWQETEKTYAQQTKEEIKSVVPDAG